QIELESARPAEAARLAQAAAERSRGEAGRAEAANALRIVGRSRIAAGEPSAAFEPLRSALDIDRELGDPRKILADLAERASSASTNSRVPPEMIRRVPASDTVARPGAGAAAGALGRRCARRRCVSAARRPTRTAGFMANTSCVRACLSVRPPTAWKSVAY